jgi:hypothetical protein
MGSVFVELADRMGTGLVELADRMGTGLVELVVVGSLALTFEIEIEKLKQNKRVFFLMFLS